MSARGLLVVGLVAVARTSSAEPVRLEISGDGCELARLSTRVTELASRDPFDDDARARIAVTTHAMSAEIRFEDADGSVRGPRRVAAKTCAALVESVATVIAMGLPVDVPTVEPEPEPEPEPVRTDPEPAKPRDPVTTLVVVADRPTTSTARWIAGAGVATTGEFLTLGARWRTDDHSLATELRLDVPSDGVAGHVRVYRAQASLSPCVHADPFAACALASIGTIRGSGARTAYTPVIAFGVRATWEHPISRTVDLRLHLDLSALPIQTQFDVDQMTVWTSPWLEGSAGIAILTRFP